MSDPLITSYAFYSSVLGLKMIAMSELTGVLRIRKKVFANEEDAKCFSGVVKRDDPDVERVRRAHQNDLENIPVFLLVGAAYVATRPDPQLALNLFRGYTAARVLHTVSYAILPQQPTRVISFFVGVGITVYMAVQVVRHFK